MYPHESESGFKSLERGVGIVLNPYLFFDHFSSYQGAEVSNIVQLNETCHQKGSVSDPHLHGSALKLTPWIRIWIPIRDITTFPDPDQRVLNHCKIEKY